MQINKWDTVFIHMYTVYKYVYVYIYSHPGVDRIADICKKDFQKKKNK